MFVTGAGRLQGWSQGELRLYIERGLLAADVLEINLPCDYAINLSKEDVEITSINIMGIFYIFNAAALIITVWLVMFLMQGEICKIFEKLSECVIWTLIPKNKKMDIV